MNSKQVVQCIWVVLMSVVFPCVLSQSCDALVPNDYCSCDFKDATGTSQGLVTLKYLENEHPPLVDKVAGKEDPNHLYSYNPCTPFTQGPGTGCQDKAACQFVSDSASYSTGTQESVQYKMSGSNVQFEYSDTEQQTLRTTRVTLICDKSAVPARINVRGEEETQYYYIDITTACACPDVCKDGPPVGPVKEGLSTGSILCIIFFVVLIVYLIIGALVNKYVRSKEGTEIVPNSGFWLDLPYLIKDGFLFAISPCKKQQAYDQI